MENNDISNVYTFLIERWTLDSYLSNLNQENDLLPLLDKFKKFDGTTIKTIYSSLKQGRNIKQLLQENQYTQLLSKEDFEKVIAEPKVTPISAFIIFYNLFSFLYVNDNPASENDSVFPYNNPLPIDLLILIMKSFNKISILQYPQKKEPFNSLSQLDNPAYYDKFVNFFFDKIINRAFSLFDLSINEKCNEQQIEAIELILIFFKIQIRLPSKFFPLFLKFINEIKRNEFSTNILTTLLQMYKENRPIIENDDEFRNLSRVIEFIQSYIQEFNNYALKLLSIISNSSSDLPLFVIEAYSSIALAITSRVVKQDQPSIVFDPITPTVYSMTDDVHKSFQDFLSNMKFIETQSTFKDGFICPEIPLESIDWLLLKFDQEIRGFVIQIKEFLLQTNENLLDPFFTTMNNVLQQIPEFYYCDCLVIFFEFLTVATKYEFISKFITTILNPAIFNEEENFFTSLSDLKNAFRNGAFSILINHPETIAAFIVGSSLPLFRAELLLRIKDRKRYSSLFVNSLDICKSLQLLDMKNHCEAIEKARCSSFYFMCSLFLELFNSYKHIEQVMSFCMEKNLTMIFVNLFEESTKTSKNFSLMDSVYSFVKRLFPISLDLSFKFIQIIADLFTRKSYLNQQIIHFFYLLMDFISMPNLNNEMSITVVQLSLDYLPLLKEIESKHLKSLTFYLSKYMTNEVFETLLQKLGKPPKGAQKVNEFPIRYPVFLPIMLFSNGLTARLMNYFIVFCEFSLKNVFCFHDQRIDSVLLQILQNKKDILYRNELFENFYVDKSIPRTQIKELFMKICLNKADFSIVSELLDDSKNMPIIDSLLMGCYNENEPVIPIPSFPIRSTNPIPIYYFCNNFSITFRIVSDLFYFTMFPEERVEFLTFKNGSLRFGIYFQGARLKAYYSNGKTRSDVNLFYFKTNVFSWRFVAITYCQQNRELNTFCHELPMNKSDFVKIEFNDDNPIIFTINNIYQNNSFLLRSFATQNVNPINLIQAHAFNKNELLGFISEISLYPKLLTIKTIFELASQKKSESALSLSNPNDFQISYQHIDNIFNVLRHESVIEKLSRMLVKKDQDENTCYYILDIIGRLVNSIDIPYVYLKLFFEDKSHFGYTKLFHCYYFSIFSNIKNQYHKQKFFDAFITKISVWMNYSNFSQILYYFQTTVITDNIYLLSKKKYFNRFLKQFHNIDTKHWDQCILILERLFDYSYVQNLRIKELAVLHCLSIRFNKILRKSNSSKESNLNRIKLTQINPPNSLIESYFNIKRPILMPSSKQKNECPILKADSSTYKKERRKSSSSIVDEYEPEKSKTVDMNIDCPFKIVSSLSDFTHLNDQNDSNIRSPSNILHTPTSTKILNNSPNIETTPNSIKSLNNSMNVEITPTSTKNLSNSPNVETTPNVNSSINEQSENIVFNTPISLEKTINENNSDDSETISKEDKLYIIYLLELIYVKASIFSQNRNATSLLIDMLKINDLDIVKKIILVLYEISYSYPLSLFTFSVYDRINHNYFDIIFDFLKENLESHPKLFPLLCAIAFSLDTKPDLLGTLQQYQLLSRKVFTKERHARHSDPQAVTPMPFNYNEKDPWYFFPILLSFTFNAEELLYLINILLQTSNGNRNILDKIIVLYTVLANFFNNDWILAKIYEYLYNFNNHMLMKVIMHCSMSIFVHPYFTNVTTTTLLLLLKKKIAENMFSYRLGIQLNSDLSKSFLQKFLLKLIDPEPSDIDEQMKTIVRAINSIFSRERYSLSSFFDISKTCDKLILDYKRIFEEQIEEIFSSFQDLLRMEPFSDAFEKVLLTTPKSTFTKIAISDNLINNQKNRLSSQIDQFYRQMIYRNHKKALKDTFPIDAKNKLYKCPRSKSYDSYCVGINCQRIGNNLLIQSETSSREFDLNQDVQISFKRDHSDIVEIFTKFGKSYRLQLTDQQLTNRVVTPKLTEKKWNDYCKQWSIGNLTNFQFLMILNLYSDRIYNRRAIFPSPIFERNKIPSESWFYSQTENVLKKNDIIVQDINLSENHFLEAKYFYDFELYNKDQIKLLYWLRYSLENCKDITIFAERELHLKIPLLRDTNYIGQSFSERRSKNEILAFSVALRPNFKQKNLTFLALDSTFNVKFYSSNKISKITSKSDTIQLTEKNMYSTLSNYPSNIQQNADIATNFLLDSVNPHCRLFKLDDGIAAFDPIKRTIIMFTISSIESISTQPSELTLTSKVKNEEDNDDDTMKSSSSQNLSNLGAYSSNMHFSTEYPNSSSRLLTPLILSTSIPGVLVKTYTKPIIDNDINLMCGNTERQFYTVSKTVVYSNNFFFTQFSSTITILKVSMQFNILVAATEDGKVHIVSSTSGKPIQTINLNSIKQNDENHQELNNKAVEIIITYHFGFILIVTNNAIIHLFTTNGTLISSSELDRRHSTENIKLWFTFDTLQGLDYFGFITKMKEIYYCEAFYPQVFVQLTTHKKLSNKIISIGYDKFDQSFIFLKQNGEISVLKHEVLVCPIDQ